MHVKQSIRIHGVLGWFQWNKRGIWKSGMSEIRQGDERLFGIQWPHGSAGYSYARKEIHLSGYTMVFAKTNFRPLPIMLLNDNRDWGPKPVRFLDIWLSDPKCMKVAKETWEEALVQGWAGFIIVQKLRAMKDRLKLWNKQDFGDINCALQDTEAKLHHLDTLSEARQLNEEEKAMWCSLKSDFWRLSNLLESFWKQKSRINWLKLGDRNTRFFQISANNRFERNLVGSVRVNGRVFVEPD